MAQRGLLSFLALSIATSSFVVIAPAKAANCTPEITSVGNQTVVAFKTVGTCTWSTPSGLTTFKGLIVGGGGGGGSAMGGGGGGGGYVEFESLAASSDVFTIVVGDGGIAGTSTTSGPAGVSGGNSSVTGSGISLISRGGAGGASLWSGSNPARSDGGSGGGGTGTSSYSSINSVGTQGSQTQTPLLGSIGGMQAGFDGAPAGGSWFPGGGGGAGGSGRNTPGTGGAGKPNAILGTSYIWAGGGGGSGYSSSGGNGGTGGGGAGGAVDGASANAGAGGLNTSTSALNNGTPGAANTGGGGGGGSWTFLGAKGGSGIVILSYLSYVGPASISIRLALSATSAVYRSTSTIEALTDVAGKVSFFQAGKPISGCRTKSTTGVSPNIKATCIWKPSNRGNIALTARITPSSDSYSASTSSTYVVPVRNRTTPR
jgi:hypothetical protein